MGVRVVELEVIKQYSHSQCFRLRIRKSEYDTLLNAEWPQGIVVQKFFHRNKNNYNRDANDGAKSGDNSGGSSGAGGGGGGGGADGGVTSLSTRVDA